MFPSVMRTQGPTSVFVAFRTTAVVGHSQRGRDRKNSDMTDGLSAYRLSWQEVIQLVKPPLYKCLCAKKDNTYTLSLCNKIHNFLYPILIIIPKTHVQVLF